MKVLDVLLGRAGDAAATALQPTISPIQTVPWADARGVLSLGPVQRAVNLICDTLADMPWGEWVGDDKVDNTRLTKRPLAVKTRRWWTWRVVATEALFNRCYLLHVGGYDSRGKPWSLLPLPPDMVQPSGRIDPFGLSFPDEWTFGGRTVPASALTIVERAPYPFALSETATGLLDLARRQFSAYLAADTHMQRYWAAGGPTTMVVTSDQELDDPDAERIQRRIRERRSMGADYPLVLGKGGHAEPWGSDPTTESAVESRREIAAEIGRYFGLPTRIMNAPAGDSETYSNVESDAIDVWRYCLRGYAGPIEDAISELLPGDYIEGRRMQLDPTRYLQGDLASRSTAYASLVDKRILTADEARLRGFGLPALTPDQRQQMLAMTTQVNVSQASTTTTETTDPTSAASVAIGG